MVKLQKKNIFISVKIYSKNAVIFLGIMTIKLDINKCLEENMSH